MILKIHPVVRCRCFPPDPHLPFEPYGIIAVNLRPVLNYNVLWGYANNNKGKTINNMSWLSSVANVIVGTRSRRHVLAASVASSSSVCVREVYSDFRRCGVFE